VSVAAIAWFAINVAGQQLIADPVALPLAAPTIAPADGLEITTVPIPPTSPIQKSTAKSVEKSSGSPPSVSPTPGASEVAITQEHTPIAVASTFSTFAGRVRARCDGAWITLAGGFAQPASGWAVKVRDGGPEQIRVRFDRSDRDDRASLLVVADCVDGRPLFELSRVERDRDDDLVRSARKE